MTILFQNARIEFDKIMQEPFNKDFLRVLTK